MSLSIQLTTTFTITSFIFNITAVKHCEVQCNRNLLSHSSGGQTSKSGCQRCHAHSMCSFFLKGRIFCLLASDHFFSFENAIWSITPVIVISLNLLGLCFLCFHHLPCPGHYFSEIHQTILGQSLLYKPRKTITSVKRQLL